MPGLVQLERPAAAEPQGLLVLHHGRGTDEADLLRLADHLDPAGRLRVVTPRAPLTLPGSPGFHWYLVPRVGYPDPETFFAARAALAGLHDRLWEETGVVVQCQNERSQTQNKAVAMQLLRSKLIELEERKRTEVLAKARGEVKDVAWGSQIRSYVLHPYTMVKDHRTEHEVGDVQRVLDGDIDEFIRDYLNKTAAASAS